MLKVIVHQIDGPEKLEELIQKISEKANAEMHGELTKEKAKHKKEKIREEKMDMGKSKPAKTTPKEKKHFNILSLTDVLIKGQVAESENGKYRISRNSDGILVDEGGLPVPMDKDVLSQSYVILNTRIPFHPEIVLNAYKEGKTIEVDYIDKGYRLVPGSDSNPSLPVEAYYEGVWYIAG